MCSRLCFRLDFIASSRVELPVQKSLKHFIDLCDVIGPTSASRQGCLRPRGPSLFIQAMVFKVGVHRDTDTSTSGTDQMPVFDQ